MWVTRSCLSSALETRSCYRCAITRLCGSEATHRPRSTPGCSSATLQRCKGFGAVGEGRRGPEGARSHTSLLLLLPQADGSRSEQTRSSQPRASSSRTGGVWKMPLRSEKDSGYSCGVDRGSRKGPPRGGPKEGRARGAFRKLALRSPWFAAHHGASFARNFAWRRRLALCGFGKHPLSSRDGDLLAEELGWCPVVGGPVLNVRFGCSGCASR